MSIVEKYNQQLKPCPFCGGKASVGEVSYGGGSNYDCGWRLVVECENCKVQMKGADISWLGIDSCEIQVRDIVEKWNKRA